MQTPYRQNPISRSVWPWQGKKNEVHSLQSQRTGALPPLVLSLVFASLLWWLDHPFMAGLVLIIAISVAGAHCYCARADAVIKNFFGKLAHFVGSILSWLLFVPFYLVCVSLGNLIFKIAGKDPMARSLDPQAATYWLVKEKNNSPRQYRRQF